MREFVIGPSAAGQRLDRYLGKLLPKAQKSLIQKSIRKKNVTLNGKKSEAKAFLREGDIVKVFFSDETFDKLSYQKKGRIGLGSELRSLMENPAAQDSMFLAVNKPVGLLTQPDGSGGPIFSDIAAALKVEGSTFSPAPLNRLDRNTSGVVIIPKSYEAQKLGAERLRSHKAKKTYTAIVLGEIDKPGTLRDTLIKDETGNKAILGGEGSEVILDYRPVLSANGYTLLEVDLKTGKTHQIRTQLANAGHPVLGDPKYGDRRENKRLLEAYGLKTQLLHAKHYALYSDDGSILFEATAEEPEQFRRLQNILMGG